MRPTTLPPMAHFGEFLREYLRILGLKKQEDAIAYFARRGLRISGSSLSYYLSGERRPTRGRMEALLDALDVPLGDARLHAYRLAAAAPLDRADATANEPHSDAA
jgi:transcriptional regulator with XRE-family HTH domain